jgi:hypothetical protein
MLHATTGTAGELLCCSQRTSTIGAISFERHGEHVMQNKSQTFSRSQHFKQHEEREANRVGQEHFLLGIDSIVAAQDWLWHVCSS